MFFVPVERASARRFLISCSLKSSARMSYFISCPNKGFCPDELFYFLPAERRLPGYMIFFPARRKASAGDIIFFPARWKGFCTVILFYFLPVGRLLLGYISIYCPWKDFSPEILFWWSARWKASARMGYFLSCRWNGCCPSLSLPLSPRIKIHPRSWGVHGAVCGCRSPWRRRALPKFLVRGRGTEAALVVVRYLMSRSFKSRRILSSSSLCCLEYSPVDTCIQEGLFRTFFLALTYSCMIGYLLLFLWQKEGKKVSIVETFLAALSNKRKKKLRFPQSGCSLPRRTHKETPKRITQR